jgi:hypothetical protein
MCYFLSFFTEAKFHIFHLKLILAMPRLISLTRGARFTDERKEITPQELKQMIADYTMDRYRPFKKEKRKENPKYDDARACWFDARVFLELLGFDKQRVKELESEIDGFGISGIRIYYGAKLIEVANDNNKKHPRHNLVMVSTAPRDPKDGMTTNDKVGPNDPVALIDEDLIPSAQNGGNLCPPCIGGLLMNEVDIELPPEETENQKGQQTKTAQR